MHAIAHLFLSIFNICEVVICERIKDKMNPNAGKGLIYKISDYLGKNNKAVLPVMVIALFKAIFRPIFTLMDKNESKDKKNYAAVRELVTEIIALGTYLGVSFAVEKVAEEPVHNMLKDAYKKAGKPAEEAISKTQVGKVLDFAAVCVAAVYIIPQVCNLVLPHAMKAIFKNQEEPKLKYDVDMPATAISTQVAPNKPYAKTSSVFNTINPYKNSSMKVGG